MNTKNIDFPELTTEQIKTQTIYLLLMIHRGTRIFHIEYTKVHLIPQTGNSLIITNNNLENITITVFCQNQIMILP